MDGQEIEEEFYRAIDDWTTMMAEILQMLHRGDLSYALRHPEDWQSHAAELVGRYRRREEWKSFL